MCGFLFRDLDTSEHYHALASQKLYGPQKTANLRWLPISDIGRVSDTKILQICIGSCLSLCVT